MTQNLGGRRGAVFSVRVAEDERAALEAMMNGGGPRSLGPWLLWRALGDHDGTTPPAGYYPTAAAVVPAAGYYPTAAAVVPARAGITRARVIPSAKRTILDLCAGTGAWSEPYKQAGYRVVRVTLPKRDVRTYVAPVKRAWGLLAAPPCTQFSLARNGAKSPRDFVEGMACVNACLRIVLQTRPRWWALENPVGKLSIFLGTPRDVFEPCDFGDPWTKRTALWGEFEKPKRGPFVKPATGKLRLARTADERAQTPAGFAQAFFEANP